MNHMFYDDKYRDAMYKFVVIPRLSINSYALLWYEFTDALHTFFKFLKFFKLDEIEIYKCFYWTRTSFLRASLLRNAIPAPKILRVP